MAGSYVISVEGRGDNIETIEVDANTIERLFGCFWEDDSSYLEPAEARDELMALAAIDLHDAPFLFAAMCCLGLNVHGRGLGTNKAEYPTTTKKLKEVLSENKVDFDNFDWVVRSNQELIEKHIESIDRDVQLYEIEHLVCVLPPEAQGWVERTFGDLACYDLDQKFDLHLRP